MTTPPKAPRNRLRQWLRWLAGYEGIPLMARPTFRYDLLASLLTTVGFAAVIPDFAKVFATKTLDCPDKLLPVFMIGPMAGHMLSVWTSQMIRQRRRIPLLGAAHVGMALAAGIIALLPTMRTVLPAYMGLVFLAAVLGSFVAIVRNGIWHSNYPKNLRGRIFGRIWVFRMLGVALSAYLAGWALDTWPWAHRLIYGLAALAFLAGGLMYMRIRIRRERELMRDGSNQPFRILEGLHLLREDRTYARYMSLQFLSGAANLMVRGGVLIAAVKDVFGFDYSEGMGLFISLPFLLTTLGTLLSGHAFDRLPLMRYRTVTTFLWATSRLIQFLGLWFVSWPILVAGFVVQGIAQSTGGVAWNIAHTRFAPPDRGHVYLGVHMTLTGIRGLTMPFLGIALYDMGLGLWVILIGTGIQYIASLLFLTVTDPTLEDHRQT